MKKIISILFMVNACLSYSQSTIQSVNSGSLITATSSVSIGEIVINPVNPNQSGSGLIGILSQLNEQLEVPEFELENSVVVYPNPTVAGIYFKSEVNLENKKVSVFNSTGQLVSEKTVQSDHSVDLSGLSSGIYMLQLASHPNKSFKIIKH